MLTIDNSLMRIIDGEHILDVGCGGGRHSWEACKQCNCIIYSLDIEETNLKNTRDMFTILDEHGESKGTLGGVIKGNVTKLPFKDTSLDKIICSEVLEHVDDDQQAISEMVRVLKDDGILAISVPSRLPETICWKLSTDYHSNPGGHVRIYQANELISKLSRNDLHIYTTHRKHALHSFYWISRCLFGMENGNALIPSLYHKFLVWDIKTKSKPIHILDDLLNTFFSKSTVFYAQKIQNRVNKSCES